MGQSATELLQKRHVLNLKLCRTKDNNIIYLPHYVSKCKDAQEEKIHCQ